MKDFIRQAIRSEQVFEFDTNGMYEIDIEDDIHECGSIVQGELVKIIRYTGKRNCLLENGYGEVWWVRLEHAKEMIERQQKRDNIEWRE